MPPRPAGSWGPDGLTPDRARLRRLTTEELSGSEVSAIRELMVAAFGTDDEERFTDDDWQHAIGGLHFVLDDAGEIISHASVVERELHVAGRPLRTGYVEAVATAPPSQGEGHGSRIMREVGSYIRDRFELGALGTGSHGFYQRLGWFAWRGPTLVRTARGEERTPTEDGDILVLTTPSTPALDNSSPISCDWRPGDVW